MSRVTKFLLLFGATARNAVRWARQHVYVLLVMTPLVSGITLWSAGRLAENAPAWPVSFRFSFALALLVEICLILYGMSRAVAEIYHVRRPESLFDALPVGAKTHLHVALVNRIMRVSLVGAIVATLSRIILTLTPRVNLQLFALLALFVLLTALAQMLAALLWIRLTGAEERRARFAVFVVATIAILPGATLAAASVLMWLAPFVLNVPTNEFSWWLVSVASLCAIALYVCIRLAHERWRAGDIERAARLELSGRDVSLRFRFVERFFKRRTAAQLARDLRLTLRSFSSIVYPVAGLAALWIVALVAALTTISLPSPSIGDLPEWLGWLPSLVAVKFACVLSCVTLLTLVPAIINYELPRFGLERATATRGEDVWEAKLWYARMITFPVPLAAWTAGVSTGSVALVHAPALLAECLWIWWMTSTLAGVLAFEIPDRLGLAVVLITTFTLGAGLFIALFWPFGLIVLVFGVPQLRARGRARARYFLIAEES